MNHFNLHLLEIFLSCERRRFVSLVKEDGCWRKDLTGIRDSNFIIRITRNLILYLDVVKYLNSRLRYESSDTLIFVSIFSLIPWRHVTCEIHDFISSLVQPTEMIPSKEENNDSFENLVDNCVYEYIL